MASGTNVGWARNLDGTKGYTWNFTIGCDEVSDGCENCYAIIQAWMHAHHPNPKIAKPYEGLVAKDADGKLHWTGRVNVIEERLYLPLTEWPKKPLTVFMNALSDLFHKDVPTAVIVEAFAVMALTPNNRYIILTKRPGRMRSLLNRRDFWYRVGRQARHIGEAYDRAANFLADGRNIYNTSVWEELDHLPNVVLGVSVEDQATANLRIPVLLETPAAVRAVSAEPLLGPINLHAKDSRSFGPQWLPPVAHGVNAPNAQAGDGSSIGDLYASMYGPNLDWVIVGGESGARARAMHPDWARLLRDQCREAGVAFWFKQWGEWGPAPFVVRVCDPQVGWTGTQEELEAAKRDAEAKGATHVHTGQWYTEDGKQVWNVHEVGQKPWSLERAEPLPEGMVAIRRWGTKKAGNLLDGELWEQFPKMPGVSA